MLQGSLYFHERTEALECLTSLRKPKCCIAVDPFLLLTLALFERIMSWGFGGSLRGFRKALGAALRWPSLPPRPVTAQSSPRESAKPG